MKTIQFDKLELHADALVLDLGCGEGRHTIALSCESEVAQIIGLDLSLKDLQTASHRAKETHDCYPAVSPHQFVCGTGMQLPFKDDSFDVIICSEVLEHIPDYQVFLKEAQRLLKTTGVFAVSVPRTWPEKICWWLSNSYHEVEGGHVRIFSAKHLQQQIAEVGFKKFSHHWAHALHVPYWWLKCLFDRAQTDNFLVRKYHQFLVWDLIKKPAVTTLLEKLLNPLMGKSVVLYFRKQDAKGKSGK